MKFTCKKSVLLDSLGVIQNAVTTKTTLPILGNVLIKAKKGALRLTATDLEIGIEYVIETDIAEEGSITLPAKKFYSIVRELPDDEVHLAMNDAMACELTCGASFFKLIGLPEDEFPGLPDVINGIQFELKQADLKEMIDKASYAVSTDQNRYFLNGLYMEFDGNIVVCAATDSRRLAVIEKEVESTATEKTRVIIPAKAIAELGKLLSAEGTVAVTIKDSQIQFKMKGCTIVSRLIDGQFPDFRKAIPAQTKIALKIDRQALLAVTRRISLVTNEKSNVVRLTFDKNALEISAATAELGEAKEKLAIDYPHEKIQIAFNPAYIVDVLKAIADQAVDVGLNDSDSAGVIRSGENFLYVIMPVRIK